MVVTRRTLLKQAFLVTVGAALIPSCMHDKSKASVILKNITVDGDQEKMLAAVSETILPTTDTPGASAIGAHLFVLKMVDDCFKKTDQEKFMAGMTAFEKQTRDKTGRSFMECDNGQKNNVIAELDKSKSQDEQSYFYHTVKRLTVQAYTSSEFFLTKVHIYKMIPGRFEGCVPLQNT